MEERVNVAELLKDCPSGMELNCTMYNNMYIDKIFEDYRYPIQCYTIYDGFRTSVNFTKFGEFSEHMNAKCVIFPKGKTTWDGFVPPCRFKDGDIIFTHANNLWISIFKEKRNGRLETYVDCSEDGSDYYSYLDGDKYPLCMESEIRHQRLATEEEKQILFQAIKDNGYKWNADEKKLEKLIEPKFKVGDRIRNICSTRIETVKSLEFDRYQLTCGQYIKFKDENEYELVTDKFDINTLVPFESRVLVRDREGDSWLPATFGCILKNNEYPFFTMEGGNYKQCIPYDKNKELNGTAADCDEYFKTWE